MDAESLNLVQQLPEPARLTTELAAAQTALAEGFENCEAALLWLQAACDQLVMQMLVQPPLQHCRVTCHNMNCSVTVPCQVHLLYA